MPVSALAYHPNGRSLAAASNGDALVRLWGVASGQCVADFQTNADWNATNLIAFSPDGKTLVTNGKGGSLLLLGVEA